jgi:cysteine synthase B
MPSSIVPGIYDPTIADSERSVSTERAHAMMTRLAREEGLVVSASAAGALVAALEVAQEIERGVVVTVFPDNRGFNDSPA